MFNCFDLFKLREHKFFSIPATTAHIMHGFNGWLLGTMKMSYFACLCLKVSWRDSDARLEKWLGCSVCLPDRPSRRHHLCWNRKLVHGLGERWADVQLGRTAETWQHHLDMVHPFIYPIYWLRHVLLQHCEGTDNYMSSSARFLKRLPKPSWARCRIRKTPADTEARFILQRSFLSSDPGRNKKPRCRVAQSTIGQKKREGDIFTRWMKAARDRRKSRRHTLST